MHGRTVYRCGCLHSQCRCIEGWRNVRRLEHDCPKHYNASFADDFLDAISKPLEAQFAIVLAFTSRTPIEWHLDRERLIDEARD